MNTKHTPTPWSAGNDYISGKGDDGASHRIAYMLPMPSVAFAGPDALARQADTPIANAAHIVRCVNAHDELVAALQAIASCDVRAPGDVVDIARAALAKVEG